MTTVTSKPLMEIITKRISEGVPPGGLPPNATDTEILKAILKALENLESVTTSEIEFSLQPFNQTTSKTANTPQALIPDTFKTSHFIIANTGAAKTGNINIGSQTMQVVPIAPGALFLYTFSLVNYVIDLTNIWINSPSASQPYVVLAFYPI